MTHLDVCRHVGTLDDSSAVYILTLITAAHSIRLRCIACLSFQSWREPCPSVLMMTGNDDSTLFSSTLWRSRIVASPEGHSTMPSEGPGSWIAECRCAGLLVVLEFLAPLLSPRRLYAPLRVR